MTNDPNTYTQLLFRLKNGSQKSFYTLKEEKEKVIGKKLSNSAFLEYLLEREKESNNNKIEKTVKIDKNNLDKAKKLAKKSNKKFNLSKLVNKALRLYIKGKITLK